MKGTHVERQDVDIKTLFEKQSVLTSYILKNNGLTRAQPEKDRIATITELFEMVNELKSDGIKYWSKQKRTGDVLEELVDVLFLLLQIGNEYQVVTTHDYIETRGNVLDHVLAINHTLLIMEGPILWWVAMAQYRGLVKMLGYDWDIDIVPQYHEKYKENVRRQKEGY